MNNLISYGIGESYLKDWGYNEALREIYQNFIDYGAYSERVIQLHNNRVLVSLANDYVPESLEFLQIGKSIKDNDNAIGKHGEGLKMAFLVFLRNNSHIKIQYQKALIKPIWIEQLIGKTLGIQFYISKQTQLNFTISFICPVEIFESFRQNIIQTEDIIFKSNYHGSIVNKPVGNLYSGGLFVTNLKNLKKSYDISPKLLSLDRDRRIPSSFEVSYHTSKINEDLLKKETDEAELNFVDQNFDDHAYISYVPKTQLEQIKVKEVLGKVEYVAEVVNPDTKEKEEVVINNNSIKQYLNNQSIFSTAINKLKNYIASKLGIKELLIDFRNKYCYSDEAKQDFDRILNKLGLTIEW